jgi:ubiquinone/menaquinone biosynthesis C-methylase UbiE
VGVALYLEIYFYEGVHLGRLIQSRLYDQWAARYDLDKQESQASDAQFLVQPLLETWARDGAGMTEPFVLDVATGTGRFPLALLAEPRFTGRVISLDISPGMLAQAAAKLAPYGDRVDLVRHGAASLPFPANSFDVVSCLEALELMPDVETPLAEFARVLMPGGVLITSRGTEASGRVGKVCAAASFAALLNKAGFEQVEIVAWWKMFDRVWARKPGQPVPAGARSLTGVLCCPACGQVALDAVSAGRLRCSQCGAEVPIGPDGVVLYGLDGRRR